MRYECYDKNGNYLGNTFSKIEANEKITIPIKWDSASNFDGAGIATATLKGRRDDGIEYVKRYNVNHMERLNSVKLNI